MAPNSVVEMLASREANSTPSGRELVYKYEIENYTPELCYQYLPQMYAQHPSYATYYVSEVKVVPAEDNSEVNPHCIATVTYAEIEKDPRENEHGEMWEWDLATHQEHITCAQVDGTAWNIAYPPASSNDNTIQWSLPASMDVGVGIGVDSSGDVKGVDIYRPAMCIKVTKRFFDVTYAMRSAIDEVLSCTNVQSWPSENGYAPGQVLFVGAHIAKQKVGVWLVEYNFLVGEKPKRVSVDILNSVPVVFTPAPWDYVWYKQVGEFSNPETGVRVRCNAIESVHIAHLYRSGDFAGLGIVGP